MYHPLFTDSVPWTLTVTPTNVTEYVYFIIHTILTGLLVSISFFIFNGLPYKNHLLISFGCYRSKPNTSPPEGRWSP